MARLIQPKTESEIRKLGVANVRQAYLDLARDYNRIIDGNVYYCHKCNDFHSQEAFYNDNRFASGLFPECKKSLLSEACDYDKSTDSYVDNREKTIDVFHKLDLPFLEPLYQSALKSVSEKMGERNKSTAYQHMLTMVKTLDQYKKLHWKDSDFGIEDSDDVIQMSKRKPRKEIIKIFGNGFTNEEYLYLQDQYDDWCARTQVDSKSQQTYVVRICHKLLDIWKAEQNGADTTKLDDSLNKLMEGANLQPRQNVSNAATDSLTFGQLIERWEEEKPIPEASSEFKDVDGIGKYIRVWFTGWLSKALGLKANVFTKEYEEEIAKYTVNKPEYTEEGSADDVYDRLFGTEGSD